MSLHGKDIKIFAGNASKHVAAQMARELGLPVGNSDVITFSDGEISVSIKESVRGSDVFVVQSTCQPVNTHIMEPVSYTHLGDKAPRGPFAVKQSLPLELSQGALHGVGVDAENGG